MTPARTRSPSRPGGAPDCPDFARYTATPATSNPPPLDAYEAWDVYTLTNVAPACLSCNASKCNSEVTTWMRRKKLDEATFLLRHAEIVRSVGTG